MAGRREVADPEGNISDGDGAHEASHMLERKNKQNNVKHKSKEKQS